MYSSFFAPRPNPKSANSVVLEGPLDEIDAYPKYLLEYLDASDPNDFVWPHGVFETLLDEKKGSWTARYKAAFRGWLDVTAPNGFLWAARGLDRLDGPKSVSEMMSVSGPHAEGHDIPATINITVAGARFGSAALKKKHPRLSGGDVSSVAILKLETKYIVSFGGDSESGPSHEAEIRIRPCVPCVYRLFMSSPTPIAKARVATEEERCLYGLSCRIELSTKPKSQDKYGDSMTPFPMSLEKQVRDLAGRKGWHVAVVKTPSDEKAIRGTRWYRIL